MRLFKLNLFAALLFVACTASAQRTVSLEPRLGMGTFRMESMKESQQTIISNSGIDAKVTDSYGAYYQFGVNLIIALNDQVRLGLFAEHGSTGGRVHYEDYSGEYKFDTPVSYNALGGLLYVVKPLNNSKFSLMAGAETNLFFTTLQTEGHIRIYNSTETQEDTFNSVGIGFKPYVGLQYPIFNIPASISMGYMISKNSAFYLPQAPDHYLVRNNNNDKLDPDWSGLRLTLTLTLPVLTL